MFSGRRNLKIGAFISYLILILAACSPASPGGEAGGGSPAVSSHGGEIGGYVEFVDALRAEGAQVSPAGEVEQPFFDVSGQVLQVDSQDVQVFEFEDQASREAVSRTISPDGSSIGASMVTWVDEPHFWAKGKLIVLYLGTNQDTINLLSQALGQQITSPAPASL